ncbi:hypothetical protein [Rhodococcus sp. OK302]|uniref:hypothetical protein n=1 Tax=Rhodococcus sp. OK302 TaxID=1882769 RepID=UPI0020CC70C0|nr:hypothetical protein [Rhodococcus sp. OK302]
MHAAVDHSESAAPDLPRVVESRRSQLIHDEWKQVATRVELIVFDHGLLRFCGIAGDAPLRYFSIMFPSRMAVNAVRAEPGGTERSLGNCAKGLSERGPAR